MTGIFILYVLFAAPLIVCIAFQFLIGTLCATGSGGGETRGEEDRERVGAAAWGGQTRGRPLRVIENFFFFFYVHLTPHSTTGMAGSSLVTD